MKIRNIKASLHRFEDQAVGELMFIDPPRPKDNIVTLAPGPGLGLNPNWDVLTDTRVQ